MDKVQKIREEVVRMHNLLPVVDGDNIYLNYADRICTTLEMYIDSLQEEPKFKVGQYLKQGDTIVKILEVSDDGYHCDNAFVPFTAQDSWKLVEEPASEELGEAADNALSNVLNTHEIVNVRSCLEMFRLGAKWQKKRDYIPLSDDINEVARQICNKVLNCEIDYKEDDVVLSDEEECVKAGIRWQMQKEFIPSKDLEELINSLSKRYPEVSFAKLSRIAVRVAKWQKEQMMAKAVDGEVGYWNLRGLSVNIENPRSVKEGDKVKMIIIKEG